MFDLVVSELEPIKALRFAPALPNEDVGIDFVVSLVTLIVIARVSFSTMNWAATTFHAVAFSFVSSL